MNTTITTILNENEKMEALKLANSILDKKADKKVDKVPFINFIKNLLNEEQKNNDLLSSNTLELKFKIDNVKFKSDIANNSSLLANNELQRKKSNEILEDLKTLNSLLELKTLDLQTLFFSKINLAKIYKLKEVAYSIYALECKKVNKIIKEVKDIAKMLYQSTIKDGKDYCLAIAIAKSNSEAELNSLDDKELNIAITEFKTTSKVKLATLQESHKLSKKPLFFNNGDIKCLFFDMAISKEDSKSNIKSLKIGSITKVLSAFQNTCIARQKNVLYKTKKI